MANKPISQLVAANAVQGIDLFVLEQGGAAKKLTGETLEAWLLSMADGHGGIASASYSPPSPPSLTGTLTLTYADNSTTAISITNGRGIEAITWVDSGTSGDGRTHTGTISYNDGTTSTVVFRDGLKGDTGAADHVYIKWASQQPSADADIGDVPDNFMGVCTTAAATAPTAYTAYTWFEVKGLTGDAATLTSAVVTYQSSQSGSTIPTNVWTAEIPTVPQGDYLWTRTVLTFNSGNPVTYYSVSRMGVDGQGAPSTETPLEDVSGGEVGTATAYARADHQHPLPSALTAYESFYVSWSLTTDNRSFSDARITADCRVISCAFDTPNNILGNITWTTATGSVTLSGTILAATTVHLVIAKVNT